MGAALRPRGRVKTAPAPEADQQVAVVDETYLRVKAAGATRTARSIPQVPPLISYCRPCAMLMEPNGCFAAGQGASRKPACRHARAEGGPCPGDDAEGRRPRTGSTQGRACLLGIRTDHFRILLKLSA